MRLRNTPNYNKSVFKFLIVCEAILLWVTFCGVIHAFLDQDERDNIGLVYLVIGIPCTAYCFLKLQENRTTNIMKATIKDFKKDNDAEMYVNLLIDLIENKHEPLRRI